MGKRKERLKKCLKWFGQKIGYILDFICSFLEMHLVKIVAFSIMCLCCFMVNALHMIIVVMLLMCLLFGISALQFSFSFIGPYLSIVFLSKMLYQTKFVPNMKQNVNCSKINASFQLTIANTIFDPEWWGYEILRDDALITYYKGYILVFAVMTLTTVIRTRQKIARIDAGLPPDIPDVLFLKTTRKDADKSLKHCFQFLINYGFYKFGVELTLSYCAFAVGYRVDVFSILYAIWLLILILPKRTTLSIIWPFFMATVLFSILWQYIMAVGLSEKTCFEYPWAQQDTLIKWMFLPNFKGKPNTKKTLVDFVLLLLIQRQQSVFELEKRFGDRYYGGSNKEDYKKFKDPDFVNPTPDHTFGIKSWIDLAKFIFLTGHFRITLGFLFWNGASNVNVLSLGYLVASFIFLWIDYDLCLWPVDKILRWWNVLLAFTTCVILLKAALEFVGCIYGNYFKKNLSFLVGLFWMHCCSVDYGTYAHCFDWDAVCFVCIIFQKRYFKSAYFVHEVDDISAIYRLQAKGAKLMDELQELRLMEFQERERKTLRKIKKSMNRIKAWQKRMQGLNYNEPADHATAIYMGDYFMFEDFEKGSSKLSSSSSEEERKPGNKQVTLVEGKSDETIHDQELSDKTEERRKEKEHDGGERKDDKHRKKEDDKDRKKEDDKDHKKEDDEDDEDEDESEEREKPKPGQFRRVIVRVMVYVTHFLNKNSEDFRYIQAVIGAERKKNKGRSSNETLHTQSILDGVAHVKEFQPVEGGLECHAKFLLRLFQSETRHSEVEDLEYYYGLPFQKLLVETLIALAKFCMSKTELLCYFCIFLHTTLAPSLIALALPILVFLWGSLTTIRPTTTFWTVMIAYTEVTVVIKAIFQNSVFPWNETVKKPIHYEYPPLFLGIHKDNQFVLADLFLLIFLFLHRYKLKTLGLWNRTHEEETFPPEDLRVYRELSSERNLKTVKGNRSLVHQRKLLMADTSHPSASITTYLRTALWKCTSRTTAKYIYNRDKLITKILVKEVEGPILVTHDGRRLQPTSMYVTRNHEEDLEGNVVLRVYTHDVVTETKTLIYKLSWIQHFTPCRKFFLQILTRDWRVSADFYTLMFIFQFINFLIIFFGYSSFANPDDIQSDDYFSLTENQVPPMFLFTIIFHFLVIIIDRVLYLRKSVIGKLVLHFLLVTLVHIWMFIVIPVVTESCFSHLAIRQTYYLISCLYFLMSAYQLRVGYPMRVQGHFLSKKYGYVNYYAYKGLQLLPFFNQLRTLLDYLCTHTSLTMSEWIKMESIFQIVFENKCSRRADIYYPSERGEECPKWTKYCPGIASFSALIIIIWFPFMIFALFNTVAKANLPQECSLEVHIGNFGNIYKTVATFDNIITFTEGQYKTLQKVYKDSKKIWTFLSLYDNRDVGVLKFKFEPFQPWFITPRELALLNETIQNLDTPVTIYIIWVVQRVPEPQVVAHIKGNSETVLTKNNTARQELADAFLLKKKKLRLNNVLPKFLRITDDGKAKPLSGFLTPGSACYRNITMELMVNGTYLWWKLEELADDANEEKLAKIPFESKNEITIYTFNEKNTPKLLLNVRKKGILGLYLSIVFVTWAFVRRLMLKYPRLMFDEMPNPDPVLQLCNDIYLARESHEFALEEDLYAKLLFLFRSPETMIKVTRLTNVEIRMQPS